MSQELQNQTKHVNSSYDVINMAAVFSKQRLRCK